MTIKKTENMKTINDKIDDSILFVMILKMIENIKTNKAFYEITGDDFYYNSATKKITELNNDHKSLFLPYYN